MKELNLRNVALMAVVASWFLQIGGQVFALVAVDSVLAMAPPRSFAMLQGEYRYNSSVFWSTVPPITFALLIVAVVANWRTGRRGLLLFVLSLYLIVGLVSAFYLEPLFDELKAVGYRDAVDPALQSRDDVVPDGLGALEHCAGRRFRPLARARTPGRDTDAGLTKGNKMPDVIPFLTYEDGIAALEWLAEAFGFTETARMTSSDGRLSHGEMSAGEGLIMLASPSVDYQGPKRHRTNCQIAASWSALPWVIDGVLVYVDDVDEHHARAKGAGAVILSEPEDGPPARRYRVEDLEGHRWMFMARN